ncbi:carboxyltransferase domain-containing protein [Arthrobacter sp. 35W]|uniref:carboxyltransferase domain-containing protein n=1 Tax=Arthrobacter sp. 35W TaxID=1132441 RepID=UPI000420FE81|nr:carboxyltransferase domain-containing protein [Arthrobacter sp. 35W]
MAAFENLADKIAMHEFGDSALMLSVRDDDPAVRRGVIADVRSILLPRLPYGARDAVAGLESLLVEFDPLVVAPRQLAQVLELIINVHQHDAGGGGTAPQQFLIPVDFRREFAPDLDDVASELGLTPAQVIEAFTGSSLRINLLAAAMAPMMDGVQFPAPVSRCAIPRTDVAAGSIMVAGLNAIIQPFPGPTGWKVIGRTPLRICDIAEQPATSYTAGDNVRFMALEDGQWPDLEGQFLRSTKVETP